ncbi:hypothetical protein AVEN_55189-1 [Araneus ventricosus]|uniref:Secreted protein n=1 Tax=Araneus ventricosus TaxID=182803 RepID=A0A4Y2J6Q2_ARAVE|nr:hypothetical protein AVEN_55189-1 [Araneus ventricosus]
MQITTALLFHLLHKRLLCCHTDATEITNQQTRNFCMIPISVKVGIMLPGSDRTNRKPIAYAHPDPLDQGWRTNRTRAIDGTLPNILGTQPITKFTMKHITNERE